MALTATRTTAGLEPLRKTTGNEVLYLPGNPGVAFTRGDRVTMGTAAGNAGTVILASGAGNSIGRVTRTMTCAASTVAFPLAGKFDNSYQNSADDCLVPVELDIAAGVQVYLATFENHTDDTVADAGSNTSRYFGLTTSLGADDDGNGGIMYTHVGPNAGELNVMEDFDHTGGNVAAEAIFHRPFNIAATTATEVVIIEGQGAGAQGCGFLGRIDLSSGKLLDAADGSAAAGTIGDGDFVALIGWEEAFDFVGNLTLPVIDAKHLYK